MLRKRSKMKGMTLIEVLIGLFVFTTVVISTTVLFSASSGSKKYAQTAQKKYDAAFTALGEVGKYLSTSTTNIENHVSGNSLTVFNYSTSECARFSFDLNKLTVRKKGISGSQNYKKCYNFLNSESLMPTTLIENVQGSFTSIPLKLNETPVTDNRSGAIIIFARVYEGAIASGTRWIPIQTTVSLRDYLVEE